MNHSNDVPVIIPDRNITHIGEPMEDDKGRYYITCDYCGSNHNPVYITVDLPQKEGE